MKYIGPLLSCPMDASATEKVRIARWNIWFNRILPERILQTSRYFRYYHRPGSWGYRLLTPPERKRIDRYWKKTRYFRMNHKIITTTDHISVIDAHPVPVRLDPACRKWGDILAIPQDASYRSSNGVKPYQTIYLNWYPHRGAGPRARNVSVLSAFLSRSCWVLFAVEPPAVRDK
jgi:hypothetical protein